MTPYPLKSDPFWSGRSAIKHTGLGLCVHKPTIWPAVVIGQNRHEVGQHPSHEPFKYGQAYKCNQNTKSKTQHFVPHIIEIGSFGAYTYFEIVL